METRQKATRKRIAAEESRENEDFQKQMAKLFIPSGSEFGSRDIVIDHNNQVSVKIEIDDHEIKTEVAEEGEFYSKTSEVKFEVEEQKIVAVHEEECDINNHQITNIETIGTKIEDLEYQNDNLEKALPLFVDHLEISTILRCRETCKQWREIIDTFLESKTTRGPYDNETYLQKMKQSPLEELSRQKKYVGIKYAYYFKSSGPVFQFNDKMKGHCDLGLSPLVDRGKDRYKNSHTEYGPHKNEHHHRFDVKKKHKRMDKFIGSFGQYIKYLKFEEMGIKMVDEKVSLRTTILECLEECPNLKTLSLHTMYRNVKRLWLEPRWNEYFQQSFNSDHSQIPANLFSISLNMYEDYDQVMNLKPLLMKKLVKPFYKDKLNKLRIIWQTNLKLNMPQLKQLTLIFPDVGNHCRENNKVLLKNKWLVAPIEKLSLKTHDSNERQFIDITKMLEMFPTIQYLKLDYGISKSIKTSNSEVLWSQNIHTLDITNSTNDGIVPYTLIRVFPNLRYFNVRVHSRRKYNIIETANSIQRPVLLGTQTIIYETQMWQNAPNLESVFIQYYNHYCEEISTCVKWPTKRCKFVHVVGTREHYRRYWEKKADSGLVGNIE